MPIEYTPGGLPPTDDPAELREYLRRELELIGEQLKIPDTPELMAPATYDPQGIQADAFDRDNHTDGSNYVGYTPAEKTRLGEVGGNAAAGTVFANLSGGATPAIFDTVANLLSALGAFSSFAIQVFTTPGADTYTPTSGMKYCLILLLGGGGGGGGADSLDGGSSIGAGGGGAGALVIKLLAAAAVGASKAIVVGAKGAGGTVSGTNGSDGSASTFDVGGLSAGGGLGGVGLATTNSENVCLGGVGGTPANGDLNAPGGNGQKGLGEGALCFGGHGASSFFGSGGMPGMRVDTGRDDGLDAQAPGSGGGGAADRDTSGTGDGAAGGDGADGLIMILELI